MTNKRLKDLIEISRKYGSDPSHVVAGGGNSSYKSRDRMWVKASGKAMADIGENGFLELDLRALLSTLERKDWSQDRDRREEEIAQSLLDARIDPPDPSIRPSVESTLHALMPQSHVLHTHGELANGVTCSKQGKAALDGIKFPNSIRPLWITYTDPGLPLAKTLERALRDGRKETGMAPNAVFMAKHGVLVAADSAPEADALMKRIDAAIAERTRKRKPARPSKIAPFDRKLETTILPALRSLLPDPTWVFQRINEPALDRLFSKDLARLPSLLPDQTVYCGPFPLWVPRPKSEEPEKLRSGIRKALDRYIARFKKSPVVFLIEDLGGWAAGPSLSDARTSRDMYASAMRMLANTYSFGGPNPLTRRQWSFIDNWSVEKYRRRLAAGKKGKGRAAGMICLVTGAAQGVGREIATALAEEGAWLLLVDLNAQALEEVVSKINQERGEGTAMGERGNVASEKDMKEAVYRAVSGFGGLDLAVSNAGVLAAHKVTEFPVETWRRIIEVNLVGYLVTAKAAADVMRRQKRGNIIQINSKSGKLGSKYNSAYSASKFGGIGLTQSLALDLVEDGVRVNAICPGNFLDLPLWSAPGGLFDQYRQKFDNAPREAVRRIYESKVPMGRGCNVADIIKTIFYILDQEYETGQAYNVTGGQEMR